MNPRPAGSGSAGAWLIAESLSRRLRDRSIVSGASLSIAPGEAVALLGPSGCGKTTLLCMLGLLDEPSSGRVLVGGEDAWAKSASERARLRLSSIGFVFQQNNLLLHLSARENVALPAWRMGRRGGGGAYEEAMERASAQLDRFGLRASMETPAGLLSTGEAQRVAIARALVNEPRVVLCDEPTGSLDSASAEAVIDCLLEVSEGGERGLLIVTHDANVAARASRTLSMRDGRLS